MTKICDSFETQDLLAFQQFTNLIPVVRRKSVSGFPANIPEVTATKVPLSTILVAHHNLVTYGVPYKTWTNPGPGKRFYTPETAINALAASTLFRHHNTEVHTWLRNATLEPEDVADVPGMSRWAHVAQLCFVTQKEKDECIDILGKDFWETWEAFHDSQHEYEGPQL